MPAREGGAQARVRACRYAFLVCGRAHLRTHAVPQPEDYWGVIGAGWGALGAVRDSTLDEWQDRLAVRCGALALLRACPSRRSVACQLTPFLCVRARVRLTRVRPRLAEGERSVAEAVGAPRAVVGAGGGRDGAVRAGH